MVQLIMIILSLTSLTICYLTQNVFQIAHILEPICPMLQNVSNTLMYMFLTLHVGMYVIMYFTYSVLPSLVGTQHELTTTHDQMN